jgi:hypothetical protein
MKNSNKFQLNEENKRIKYLRFLSDLTVQLIYSSDDFWEAMKAINQFRQFVDSQFPGKEFQFQLIYGPRFYRVLEEKGFLKTNLN